MFLCLDVLGLHLLAFSLPYNLFFRFNVSAIKAFVKEPKRITAVVDDIAAHFSEIVQPTELKALIVTIDRETCALYKNSIDKLRARCKRVDGRESSNGLTEVLRTP